MRRTAVALLAISLALPLEAWSQPLVSTTPRPPVIDGPPPLERAQVGPPDREYAPTPHLDAGQWTRTGWGLFATASGRSMDLATRSAWAEDPNARPAEIEVGFGWRRANVSAMIGYAQPDFGPKTDHSHILGSRGLVGLSVALRLR